MSESLRERKAREREVLERARKEILKTFREIREELAKPKPKPPKPK